MNRSVALPLFTAVVCGIMSRPRLFIGRPVMDRSLILALIVVGVVGGSVAAQAGPCSTQISQVEREIARLQATARPAAAR